MYVVINYHVYILYLLILQFCVSLLVFGCFFFWLDIKELQYKMSVNVMKTKCAATAILSSKKAIKAPSKHA